MSKRKTTEQFIIEAKQVHSDKYDYSKTIYKSSSEKVIISCKEHGDFEQRANHHLTGSKCPKCSKVSFNNKRQKSTEQFITEAKQIHGDKYIYDKTNYTGSRNKLIITCPEHGDFEQFACNHLSGQGCPKCKSKYLSISQLKSTEQFIIEANKVHGDKYDYSKTEYKSYSEKVIITCKQHGDFEQRASVHLKGSGCQKCAVSNISKFNTLTTEEFIYRATLVHQDYYDYSKVDYKKSKEKVIIICPEHSEFKQRPNTHLSGSGCPKCMYEITVSKAEKEIFEFINRLLNPELYE